MENYVALLFSCFMLLLICDISSSCSVSSVCLMFSIKEELRIKLTVEFWAEIIPISQSLTELLMVKWFRRMTFPGRLRHFTHINIIVSSECV